MKVLYVIDSLVPGGAESSLAALAPLLVAAGIDLNVAYLKEGNGPIRERLETNGVETRLIEGGRGAHVAGLRRLIAAGRPDLVHTTLFEADIAGRVAGACARTKVVSSLVNIAYGPAEQPPGVPRWKTKGAHFVDATTARSVTRWHAISRYVAEVMGTRLRLPRDRIEVIPRARELDPDGRSDARRMAARGSLGIDSTAPMLLSVGRHEHQKGLDLLLRAFRLVLIEQPEARLFIAGRAGNRTSDLRTLAGELGISASVELLGLRDDVADLMCGADVFVFPSRWEGLGSVLLEAMAFKLPIVASDLPPIRELLPNEEHALFFPVEDFTALAARIGEVLGDGEGARRRADNSYLRLVGEYSIKDIAARMVGFYERALG